MPLTALAFGEKSRLRALLEHFSLIEDPREPWKVAHPLAEVLLLVVCGTIADCDDYDHIAAWGEAHLPFLRGLQPYHHGVPGGRWLTLLMNRIDPGLFSACFTAWVREMWPDRPDFIAIDGKTSRRSGDKRKGLKALHTLSAYATNARLTLAQLSVPEKTNEIAAIPELLDQLAETDRLAGALVTIDAMGCQVDIADKIVAHGADYLLALKGNQPTMEGDVKTYFDDAPDGELVAKTTVEKGHGRIETRAYTASANVSWITSDRSYPGQPRFTNVKTILKVHDRVEYPDRCSFETRYYISSAALDIERLSAGARGHWGSLSMHWLLDVVFKDDLSRYRKGNGAKNMAVVRRFSLNLIRANKAKGSIKTKRKAAGWDPSFLLEILQQK